MTSDTCGCGKDVRYETSTGMSCNKFARCSEEIDIEVRVQTNIVGSLTKQVFQVNRSDWNDMDDREKDEMMLERMFEMVEWNYEEK